MSGPASLNALSRLLGATWSCFTIAIATSAARFLARGLVLRSFGCDDVLMLASLPLCTGTAAISHIVHDGHRQVVLELQRASDNGSNSALNMPAPQASTAAQLERPSRILFALSIIYPFALTLAKLSVLAFYRRFLPRGKYQYSLLVLAVALGLLGLAIPLTVASMCKPASPATNLRLTRCPRANSVAQGLVNAFNLFTDIFLLVLPMPVLLQLHTSFRKKVGLVLLFSLGGIGTVVTTVRLWKVVVLTSTLEREVGSVRWFIEATHVVMLSHIEVCIVIICANFPGLAALRKHHDHRRHYVPHERPQHFRLRRLAPPPRPHQHEAAARPPTDGANAAAAAASAAAVVAADVTTTTTTGPTRATAAEADGRGIVIVEVGTDGPASQRTSRRLNRLPSRRFLSVSSMNNGLLGDVFATGDGDNNQGNSGQQDGGSGRGGTDSGDDYLGAVDGMIPLSSLVVPRRSSSLSCNMATAPLATAFTIATTTTATATTAGTTAATAATTTTSNVATELMVSEPSPKELEGDTPARQA